jgi:hypothetical protein
LLLGHRPSWLTRALCFMPTWVQSNFTASARVQTVSREAAKFAKFLGILFGSVPDSENLSQHPSGSANKRSLVCHSGAQRRSMGREVEESKGRAVEETGRITRYGIVLPTRYSMLATRYWIAGLSFWSAAKNLWVGSRRGETAHPWILRQPSE